MSAERPDAILFDLGGVLTDVSKNDAGFSAVASELHLLLGSAGQHELGRDDIEADLREGAAAYSAFKHAQSRTAHPHEISAEQFWEFTTVDWPPQSRALVRAHAVPLATSFELSTLSRPVKQGVPELLDELCAKNIKLGVVCNCLSGEGSRLELSRGKILDKFQVLVFSAEVGLRKPDPEIVWLALGALGCSPERAWLLGDTYDRDILAARRAGIAKAILVHSEFGSARRLRGVEADLVATSPLELRALI